MPTTGGALPRDESSYYKYERLWGGLSGKNNFYFNLRATTEAHLLLAEYLHVKSHLAYEVRFGDGDEQTIGIYNPDNSLCVSTSYIHRLLDELEYRAFWVSWDSANIKIGEGPVSGERMILTCPTDSPPAISAFAVDIGGVSLATWLFADSKGMSFL